MRGYPRTVAWLAVSMASHSRAALPKWAPTYNMSRSTIFMPCNDSGFTSPEISAKWGVVDFDWSNGKRDWTLASPMDCEERLVQQAALVKSVNPTAKVWIYRNLVKALPWYSSVREKLLDPQYSGFFLKFNQNSSAPPPHVPKCTNSKVGNPPKCSEFYHDQEQTPQNGQNSAPPPPFNPGPDHWTRYNPGNGVAGMHPAENLSIWLAPGTPADYPSFVECENAATVAMKNNTKIRMYTWWLDAPSSNTGTCWFHNHVEMRGGRGYSPEANHVMGYRGPAADAPAPIPTSYNVCSGDCDCGEGLPCGEYLWDYRNGSMLADFLVNEFVLNPTTGLKNENVDGFFFDDSWTNKPSPIPSWAPKTYRQCDMWKTGGATEEDYYCVVDMGLTQQDTDLIVQNHNAVMQRVLDAVVDNGGFAWPLLTSRTASLDLKDPRPRCAADLRNWCTNGPSSFLNKTLMFEFTRKTFHDAFPLPYIEQDLAQFMLVRGAYGYIGHSWMGCIQPSGYVQGNSTKGYERPPALDVDYGEPVDPICSETAAGSGVFTREWTKASVKMDCNSYEGTIIMKPSE
eukprot:m.10340 g.10340  ORF g.10340 m.10340 type:complete len:569 (+) comp4307_c0_seq1:82-1788(+)